MPFLSFKKDEAIKLGAQALDLKLPFVESEVLRENLDLIKRQLGLEEVEVMSATDPAASAQVGPLASLLQQNPTSPGNPTAIFLSRLFNSSFLFQPFAFIDYIFAYFAFSFLWILCQEDGRGFEVKVVTSDDYIKSESGLIFRDYEVGKGECPKAGQQVTFHYIGYNESGRRIDSTYLQGSPARIHMGTNAVFPGFEEGIKNMKPGGKRRIIIPPELGPPVSDCDACFCVLYRQFSLTCFEVLFVFLMLAYVAAKILV
ncbi:hypothetical protein CCACVL1_19410 [Corchorus capsularis]|uniref:peptidylprolyl isomerase n=1 Tax=Corchorus capsularis TaxID=210143 RepID=A0A1R3HGQ2_COCAP|nr:hypothetical protein CCACVL1_19410 [Corchorus capsularis]